MRESLAGRSLEERTLLQPQVWRAEQQACERVRRERQERVPEEEYRRQRGGEFLVLPSTSDIVRQSNKQCDAIDLVELLWIDKALLA